MNRITIWWRGWEITINSNSITTVLMAMFLPACGALLIKEIVDFVIGNVSERLPLRSNLLTNITNAMIAVCYFSVIFSTLAKLAELSFTPDSETNH